MIPSWPPCSHEAIPGALEWKTLRSAWEWVARHGLAAVTGLYPEEADGRLVFRGERPGPEWVGHGTFARMLWTLFDGSWRRITVHKQRWRHRQTGETCHSRPPDDLASVWFCSLVVATVLWGWLSSEKGLHTHEPILPALSERPSTRTVQRWVARARKHADETATALRRAVRERSEPRPREYSVRGGLSPPGGRGDAPGAGTSLHQGLFHLFEGAHSLDVHVAILLAEARGRQHEHRTNWLI